MMHALLRRIAVGSGALTVALSMALGGMAAACEAPSGGVANAQPSGDQPAST